jgi:hypothetical protein
VLSVRPTVCAVAYVPPATEKAGAAVTGWVTIYVAVAVELCTPPATAMALMVVVPAPTAIGPAYTADDVVGLLPFVV